MYFWLVKIKVSDANHLEETLSFSQFKEERIESCLLTILKKKKIDLIQNGGYLECCLIIVSLWLKSQPYIFSNPSVIFSRRSTEKSTYRIKLYFLQFTLAICDKGKGICLRYGAGFKPIQR